MCFSELLTEDVGLKNYNNNKLVSKKQKEMKTEIETVSLER